jgi:hypothetical protein
VEVRSAAFHVSGDQLDYFVQISWDVAFPHPYRVPSKDRKFDVDPVVPRNVAAQLGFPVLSTVSNSATSKHGVKVSAAFSGRTMLTTRVLTRLPSTSTGSGASLRITRIVGSATITRSGMSVRVALTARQILMGKVIGADFVHLLHVPEGRPRALVDNQCL